MLPDRQDDPDTGDRPATGDRRGADTDAPSPAALLLDAARQTVPGWLRTAIAEVAVGHGVAGPGDDPELRRVVDDAARQCLVDLEALLDRDVDEQRSNPLSVLRGAVVAPSRLLVERGARPSSGDAFRDQRFPDDPFGIGPATWSDISPELHEPGLTWGAWKALTVLQRRRADGLR